MSKNYENLTVLLSKENHFFLKIANFSRNNFRILLASYKSQQISSQSSNIVSSFIFFLFY